LDGYQGGERKTVSKAIPPEQVENTFAQIERFHQFQNLTHEYTEINIKICDEKLRNQERQFPGRLKRVLNSEIRKAMTDEISALVE